MKTILAIVGSARANSSNESILRWIAENYSDKLKVTVDTTIKDLPFFNPDVQDDAVASSVIAFRERIDKADGVIICTPEYVFALPGVLKNALEWTVSTTVFSDKPLAIIVASGIGEKTFESLVLVMTTLGARISENSKLLIKGPRSRVVNGALVDEGVKEELRRVVEALISEL